jgi:hypothetical protein
MMVTVFKVLEPGLDSEGLFLVVMGRQLSTTIARACKHSVARMLPRWVELAIAAV